MHARLKPDLPSEAETLKRMGVPSHEEVAARAYELFEERGRTHGHDLDDWLQAENELLEARQEHLGL